SDIYFLGCVLFEILLGYAPLDMTKDRHARMARRRFEDVKHLKQGEIPAPPSTYQLVETMMALNPQQRYQTPSQLVDAIRAARRNLGAGTGQGKPVARSVFLAESDIRLQDALRERFKEMGYRVFVASDPARALDRYRQQPFDALVVDVGTVGEDGLL